MKVFVDTSALYALLDEDDEWHPDATRLFGLLAANADLISHNYVHIEAIALVARRLGEAAAAKLVDVLLPALATVWIDREVHAVALAAYRMGAGVASFVDHVSFEVMRRQGIAEAFAFDADFERQGFQRVRTRRRGVHEAVVSYGAVAPTPNLVSVSEIAARADRPINTVQSWRRRHIDFPDPVARLAAGPIWDWPAVEAWITSRERRSRRVLVHK